MICGRTEEEMKWSSRNKLVSSRKWNISALPRKWLKICNILAAPCMLAPSDSYCNSRGAWGTLWGELYMKKWLFLKPFLKTKYLWGIIKMVRNVFVGGYDVSSYIAHSSYCFQHFHSVQVLLWGLIAYTQYFWPKTFSFYSPNYWFHLSIALIKF